MTECALCPPVCGCTSSPNLTAPWFQKCPATPWWTASRTSSCLWWSPRSAWRGSPARWEESSPTPDYQRTSSRKCPRSLNFRLSVLPSLSFLLICLSTTPSLCLSRSIDYLSLPLCHSPSIKGTLTKVWYSWNQRFQTKVDILRLHISVLAPGWTALTI